MRLFKGPLPLLRQKLLKNAHTPNIGLVLDYFYDFLLFPVLF
jgi:hypothetical protein